MTSATTSLRPPGFVTRVTEFFSGGRFPAFSLCALVFYQVFVAVMAFAPPAAGVWGEFLEDFRLRCFKFDARGGGMELSSVWVMLAEPVPLQVILLLVWWRPLQVLWRRQRAALLPLAGAALALVGLIAASLLGLGRAQAKPGELPFPADRLRTALPMPAFALRNQDDQPVALADFKGRVVLVTAVYSTCTTTCPMMLTKIRTVLDQLTAAERGQLAVVAFSLNPEADTRELRTMTSKIYGMKAPQFHFVSGVPAQVNALLDQLNVARTRDEATGQIMHSNLFFLLDREGRIAYRLSLSQTEQAWLISALRVLLAEAPTLPGRSEHRFRQHERPAPIR
ncbi:MAG TPA: SCO family protein [Methylomirabilota bacterium]|nr:SCO family protein [Methylomirabilota bacterium]